VEILLLHRREILILQTEFDFMEETQKKRSNAIIQLDKISVFQNSALILANVSLSVERGELFI